MSDGVYHNHQKDLRPLDLDVTADILKERQKVFPLKNIIMEPPFNEPSFLRWPFTQKAEFSADHMATKKYVNKENPKVEPY